MRYAHSHSTAAGRTAKPAYGVGGNAEDGRMGEASGEGLVRTDFEDSVAGPLVSL